MQTICPWCDAEIVWDEEIGPEEMCPHCFNDLGNYRSVSLDEPEVPKVVQVETSGELLEFARKVLQEQEEWLLCGHCEEPMVHVGTQTLDESRFQARKWQGKVILQPPFSYEVFVCPNCDKLEQVLSLTDKHKWLAKVKNGQ
jgi:hypothetical protein